MVSDKLATDAYGLPLFRETYFKPGGSDGSTMKKYHASFVVKKGRDGGLYAADIDQGIFTDGMTREELINNIHEAVECHFDIPSYEDVDIRIKFD
jgi:predicted RNase H-like HicB family nuclease